MIPPSWSPPTPSSGTPKPVYLNQSSTIARNLSERNPPLWASEVLLSSDSEYSSDDSPPNTQDVDFIIINSNSDSDEYMDVDTESYEDEYWDNMSRAIQENDLLNPWNIPNDNPPAQPEVFNVWNNGWMTAAELHEFLNPRGDLKRKRDETEAEQHLLNPPRKKSFRDQ